MFGRVCKAAYSVALILYTIMVLPFTHKTVAWSQGCLYAKARIYALFQSSDQGRAATEWQTSRFASTGFFIAGSWNCILCLSLLVYLRLFRSHTVWRPDCTPFLPYGVGVIDLFFVQVDQTILVYSLCALSTWKFSAGTTRQSKFCKYFFAHVTISCAQAACSWCESNFNTPGIMTYARFCLSQCYCCVNSCNAFWVPKFRCSVNALLQFVLAAYMHRVSHKAPW